MRLTEEITIPSRYRWRYEMSSPFTTTYHVWTLVGEHGGVHLHISDMGVKMGEQYDRFSGGVECHYRTPPSHMEGQPPSHDECQVLKAPCWHDGSSLIASEQFVPILARGGSHGEIFERLVRLADSWLNPQVKE